MRDWGIFKAITEDELLYSLVIIAKLLYLSRKRLRKTGVNYENRTASRNISVLVAQPSQRGC